MACWAYSRVGTYRGYSKYLWARRSRLPPENTYGGFVFGRISIARRSKIEIQPRFCFLLGTRAFAYRRTVVRALTVKKSDI
jgi:hypothetical protein